MHKQSPITNKNILLGVTGGIAAYKTCELIRLLKKQGANVRVVMTKAAESFVTPLSLQTLSGNPVKTDCWSLEAEHEIDHIALARWADLLLIAPASANYLAKMAQGIADDLLSTIYLATTAPVAIAPAMNQQMWAHQATKRNVQQLAADQVMIWGPGSGEQACGEVGAGRMLEPLDLLDHIETCCTKLVSTTLNTCASEQDQSPQPPRPELANCNVLITAGPTREAIDPVRYLSNNSSGKMGFAIAEAMVNAGARVTLIAGPVALTPPAKLKYLSITSAEEMFDAVMTELPGHNIFIATAAVADYTPAAPAAHKLKKQDDQNCLQLELRKTPDILAEVAASTYATKTNLFTVGFAAETEQLLQHATIKRKRKNVDLLCANLVGKPGTGFEAAENEITVISDAATIQLPRAHKRDLAQSLVTIILEKFHEKCTNKNRQ